MAIRGTPRGFIFNGKDIVMEMKLDYSDIKFKDKRKLKRLSNKRKLNFV